MKNLNQECKHIAMMCEALNRDKANTELKNAILESIIEVNQYCIGKKTLPNAEETTKIKEVSKLLPKCNRELTRQFTRFMLIEHSINIYKAS